MSLESGRKSDLYEKMLEEGQVEAPGRQSLGAMEGLGSGFGLMGFGEGLEVPGDLQPRKSDEVEVSINHTCDCYQECSWGSCSCREARYELCLRGYCCAGCIDMKQKMMRGELEPVVEAAQPSQQLFCNCKKIKCKKMYCTCFAAGVLCGPKCTCEGCTNCLMPPEPMEMEEERDEISEEELARMQMPESMDFEPFEFRLSNNAQS